MCRSVQRDIASTIGNFDFLKEVDHDPSDVLKAMIELRKEWAIREDDRRPAIRNGKPSSRERGNRMELTRVREGKPQKVQIRGMI